MIPERNKFDIIQDAAIPKRIIVRWLHALVRNKAFSVMQKCQSEC